MANKAIVGQKIGMTQVWDADSQIQPVTVVKVDPCRIVAVRSADGADGYEAVQVTFGSRSANKLTLAEAGHFESAGVDPGVRLVRRNRLLQPHHHFPGLGRRPSPAQLPMQPLRRRIDRRIARIG